MTNPAEPPCEKSSSNTWRPTYTIRTLSGALPTQGKAEGQPRNDPYVRAKTEDDDGYDPYSDRPPTPDPLFQKDPWR